LIFGRLRILYYCVVVDVESVEVLLESDHFLPKYRANKGDRKPDAVATSKDLMCGVFTIDNANHTKATKKEA
jgi:hypothetical protein